MRSHGLLVGLAVLAGVSAARADVYDLIITGAWTAGDYDVTPTAPAGYEAVAEGDDDKVFGVAPSAGSTTFTVRVDTSSNTGLFAAGYLSNGVDVLAHDWVGYTNVQLVGTHTFGSATWTNSGVLTDLVGVDGLTAALWSDTDLTSGTPGRVSFRMQGEGDGLVADLFVGERLTTEILDNFLLWEYFGGEEIRVEPDGYTVASRLVPEPASVGLLAAGGLALLRRRAVR